MTANSNTYGTVEEVAAMTRRYTNGGAYDSTTNPTATRVAGWLVGASATINVPLAAAGFAIPIVQDDARVAVTQVVVEAVIDLCHAANSAGRFFTERALERGVSPMRVLRQEMADWVESQADGLEMLGAERTRTLTSGILYRDRDEKGDPTFPIFQRDGFSNTFTDWDQG